jgi:hypothetical protein
MMRAIKKNVLNEREKELRKEKEELEFYESHVSELVTYASIQFFLLDNFIDGNLNSWNIWRQLIQEIETPQND